MHQWRALTQGEYAQLQLFPFRSPAVAAAKSRVHAALQQHLRRRARSRQPDPFPIHERAAQQPPHEPGAVLWHTVTAGCGGDAATHRQGGGGGGAPARRERRRCCSCPSLCSATLRCSFIKRAILHLSNAFCRMCFMCCCCCCSIFAIISFMLPWLRFRAVASTASGA